MDFKGLDLVLIPNTGKGVPLITVSQALIWYNAEGLPRIVNPRYAVPRVYATERDISITGQIDLRYNVLHVDKDIYIPARRNREPTVKQKLLDLFYQVNELKAQVFELGEKVLHMPTLS